MKKPHYAWIIVAASFLSVGVSAGQLMNCYSLLVVPICNDLGIPRSAMGLSQTITGLGSVIVPMLAGPIYKRFRLKPLMLFSAVCMIASYFCLSLARSIVPIYIIVLVMSVSQALVCWMPFSIILNNWFRRDCGTAMGIAFMGSGIFGMVFSFLDGLMLGSIGWRMLVVVNSAVAALLLMPTLIFVIREKPEDMGLRPYGEGDAPVPGTGRDPMQGASLREELRRPRLWCICLSCMALGFCVNSITACMNPYINDSYGEVLAANVMAGYMASLAAGKILLGIFHDRLGTRRACLISNAALAVSLASLVFVRFSILIVPLMLCSGIAGALSTVSYPNMARDTFGLREYSSFAGLIMCFGNSGGTLSPVVFGLICDTAGSYRPGYIICVALTFVSAAVLFRFLPDKALNGRDRKA